MDKKTSGSFSLGILCWDYTSIFFELIYNIALEISSKFKQDAWKSGMQKNRTTDQPKDLNYTFWIFLWGFVNLEDFD